MRPVRVIVADDDEEVREAAADLLRTEGGFQVAGVASDAEEAIALAVRESPDVALLDVKMPGGGGERAAREIRALCPLTRVLAFSAYEDRATVLEMLRAGAHGYLTKGASADEIVSAIHRCVGGGGVLGADVAAEVIDELATQLEREQQTRTRQQARLEPIRRVLSAPSELVAIVFQPIVDLASGAVVGAEALARFGIEPKRPPDIWFGEAGQLDLLVELELAVLATTIRHFDAVPPPLFLAVNLSPATTLAPAFYDAIEPVPPGRLVIEVTEHVPVEDYAELARSLTGLRSRGARLSIDDAGAGYASLRHILRLAPDLIKLDISLTRSIDTDRARRALAAALIGFAREIGAAVIAEGVETRAERDTLVELGAGFGQGFFLARPAPPPIPLEIPTAAGRAARHVG